MASVSLVQAELNWSKRLKAVTTGAAMGGDQWAQVAHFNGAVGGAPASWSAPVLWRFSGSRLGSAAAKAPEDWRTPKPCGISTVPSAGVAALAFAGVQNGRKCSGFMKSIFLIQFSTATG